MIPCDVCEWTFYGLHVDAMGARIRAQMAVSQHDATVTGAWPSMNMLAPKDARNATLARASCRAAYGLSETTIGVSGAPLDVATKFGNPCERNGERHDYSPAEAVDSLYASLAALRNKRLACLQVANSPPRSSLSAAPCTCRCMYASASQSASP